MAVPIGVPALAVPRFRPSELLEARRRAGLTQRQLATLAVEASLERRADARRLPDDERVRRIRTWESRIGAWENGVDAPSASYVPTLARLLGVDPLQLFNVDPVAPPFTALRLAAGYTLQALAGLTDISYTSLHRMVRGVRPLPEAGVEQLAEALHVSRDQLLASIERERLKDPLT